MRDDWEDVMSKNCKGLGRSKQRLMGCDVRRAVVLTLMAASAGILPDAVFGQAAYPNNPIHLVVGFAAGGPSDAVARVAGQQMSEILGQQIVIENRTGAGGTIATDYVAGEATDGYTLMLLTTANATNETL